MPNLVGNLQFTKTELGLICNGIFFLVENFIFLKSHQNVRLFPRILVRVIGLEVKLFRNQFTFIKFKLVLTCHHSAGKQDHGPLYPQYFFT